jgi:hypothetical protein
MHRYSVALRASKTSDTPAWESAPSVALVGRLSEIE